MRRAVLDLGSNSFHVLVADVDPAGYVDPVARERQMLHLGRVVAQHGRITPEAADRAVASVEHLAELARRTGAVDTLAVATSALRDADNGREVVERLATAAGAAIRVLPGPEEARLGYLGVRAAIGVETVGLAVIDLGGGSLELAVGTQRTPDLVTSSDIGVSRLSALVSHDPVKRRELDRLHEVVDDELALAGGAFEATLPDRVVAVGGTVRAMARVVAAQDGMWVPMTLNRIPVTLARLRTLRDRLCTLDRDDRADLDGMKAKRADHLHIACVVLVRVLEHLGVDDLEVCDWGLREGVLLDAAATSLAPTPASLRAREIERLRRLFTPDDPHNAHTARLAMQLFDLTQSLHGLSDDDRELLHHAATVHDVGEALALRRHHRHGAYLLEHAELRGFAPADIAMVVAMVRYHNASGLKDGHPAVVGMTQERRRRTAILLALLQSADVLDRTRDQSVTGLALDDLDEDRIVLRIHGSGLRVARAELARKTALLEDVLDRRLEVRTPTVV